MNRHDDYRNGRRCYEPQHDDDNGGYTQEDLDRMYEDAFEGDPEAQWNID